MNETLQVEASTLAGGKRFCESTVQTVLAQTSRNSLAIQDPFVDTASSPVGPDRASLPETLPEGPLGPLPPSASRPLLALSFPSWVLSLDGFFYFQLHSFFHNPPCAQDAASPFELAKHLSSPKNTPQVPAPPSAGSGQTDTIQNHLGAVHCWHISRS